MGLIKKDTSKVNTTSQLEAEISSQHLRGCISSQHLRGCIGGQGVVTLRDHDQLRHLGWAESGHIGFAGIQFGTTAEWNAMPDYRPLEGMLVVYTDYKQIDDGQGNITYVPGIKVGDGNAYLIDKPFITESLDKELTEHINDMVKHITQEEREFWNNKLNYVEPEDDLLEFTRN